VRSASDTANLVLIAPSFGVVAATTVNNKLSLFYNLKKERQKTTTYKKMQRFLKSFKKIAAFVSQRLYWSDNSLEGATAFCMAVAMQIIIGLLLHGHSQRMGLSRPSVTQQDAGL
jgi:hypothetical protein